MNAGDSTGPVKGVIFDLDGTLYHMRWFLRACITLRAFPHVLFLPRYMKVREEFAGRDLHDSNTLFSTMTASLTSRFGGNGELVRGWMQDGFYRAFLPALRLMRGSRPGLSDVLSGLRRRGVRTAVLSDFGRVAERLRMLGIDPDQFDTLASCEEQGALKPAVRPFLAIARQWHCAPSEVLVVGDRQDTDGSAAASAGMRFWLLREERRQLPLQGNTWSQLRPLLEELSS